MATVTLGRGTTPVYVIRVTGIETSLIDDVYITFEQEKSNQELTKHLPDIRIVEGDEEKETYVYLQLTQEETLAFQKGSGKLQIRFLDKEGNAFKSVIVNTQISDVLYEEVID